MEKTVDENIGLFKLISGEEIIAKYDSLTADSVTVKKARAVLIVQDRRTGKPALGFGPWILTESDDEYRLDREHIMAMKIANLNPQLIEEYLKNAHGLDVQTAAASIVKPA